MPKVISLHDVLEPLKQALWASRNVIISSQICGSNLQKVFTLGDGCWLPMPCFIVSVLKVLGFWGPKNFKQSPPPKRSVLRSCTPASANLLVNSVERVPKPNNKGGSRTHCCGRYCEKEGSTRRRKGQVWKGVLFLSTAVLDRWGVNIGSWNHVQAPQTWPHQTCPVSTGPFLGSVFRFQ